MNPAEKTPHPETSGEDDGDLDFETPESEQEETDHQSGDVEHGPPEEDDEDED